MPNLKQIEFLRNKYNVQGITGSKINLQQIKALHENFNFTTSRIKLFFNSRGLNNHILEYLEDQKSADVILLFIDITDFSKICQNTKNYILSAYLDDYYDEVIPIIYDNGGEIEKIIGDGIICLFGEPFLTANKDELFSYADSCAKDIIAKLKDTNKEVKIALHDGQIMYYKNKSKDYSEYTMIGKPMTELFRLESVSDNNSINYYQISNYNKLDISDPGLHKGVYSGISGWEKSSLEKVELKGVEWKHIKRTTCVLKL